MRIYYYTIKTDNGTKVVKETTLKAALKKIEAKRIYSAKRASVLTG